MAELHTCQLGILGLLLRVRKLSHNLGRPVYDHRTRVWWHSGPVSWTVDHDWSRLTGKHSNQTVHWWFDRAKSARIDLWAQ